MKTENHPPGHDCPADVLGWIPWYPDGLEEAQRGAVEAHAATCTECRDEIAMLQGVAEADASPEPERIYAQVLARMEAMEPAGESSDDEAEERPVATVSRLPSREERAAAESPERVGNEASGWRRISRVQSQRGLAVAAGLLMALALGSWMAAPDGSSGEEPVYKTASAALAEADTAPAGARLDVVFREEASAGEINRALQVLGARIRSGPSQLGVYRLELDAQTDVDAAKKLLTEERGGVATFAGKPLHP